MLWRKYTLVSLNCFATLCQSVLFLPNNVPAEFRDTFDRQLHNASSPIARLVTKCATPIGGGVNLRILPLGDSITYGYKSSDGNGYRYRLEQDLSIGNKVDMVGSVSSGNMSDNQNEGHNGAVISEIANCAKSSLPMRPNIVLLHAGTNDMNLPKDPDNAPARLGSLIDQIASACPDAAVLVAKIIPASNSATMSRINTFNAAVVGVVAQRAIAGKKVMVVDLSTALTIGDLSDGLHPNDEGYRKMGDVWYSGIQKASDNGWIKSPVEGSRNASGACSGDHVGILRTRLLPAPDLNPVVLNPSSIPKVKSPLGLGRTQESVLETSMATGGMISGPMTMVPLFSRNTYYAVGKGKKSGF